MKVFQNEQFVKIRAEQEKQQLARLKSHPLVPHNFDWEAYLLLNPEIKRKGFNTEVLALRHWIKQGHKLNLQYSCKEDEKEVLTQEQNFKLFPPEPIHEISVNERKRGVIYTCITNDYDSLKNIPHPDPAWDYICFTNSVKLFCNGWQCRPVPEILNKLDPVRRARALKILPHVFLSEYDTTIWLDGAIQIIKSPEDFIQKNMKPNDIFGISYHPDRTCIYQEAEACIKFKKESEVIIQNQIKSYREKGYPEKWGLVQSGIIFRRNIKEVHDFCDAWWNEIVTKSKRDQLSFNYVHWKNPIPIRFLKPSIMSSEFFEVWSHSWNNSRKINLRKNYDSLQNYINGKPI